MPDFFRDQPAVRLAICAAIALIAWTLYIVRLTLGVGPMHDHDGSQAPALHYLIGALVVTGMVAAWIALRAIMTRRRS
jgi:hypothetical protein